MPQTIVVRNPGFDPPFPYKGGDSHLKVANGWGFVWEEGPDTAHGFLVRPECYPKELLNQDGLVVDYCQGVQTTNATHRAALVQAVALPLGARGLGLSLEVRVAYHGPESGMAIRVGLDGTGQTRILDASTIRWGGWLNQEGDPPWEAGKFSVATANLDVPETGYVSLWLFSQNKWRGKNNHVFWRDISLQVGDGDGDPDPGSAAEMIMQAVDILIDAVAKL